MVGGHDNKSVSVFTVSLTASGRQRNERTLTWAGVVSSGERTILACWEKGHPTRRTKRRKARTTLVNATPVPDAPQKPRKITLHTKK